MAKIYSDILTGMMDTFASVISNNLNIVMKILSVITIVLTIPNIITSAFGMNVGGIPLSTHPLGFWIICGLALALTLIVGIIIGRTKSFR